MKTNQSFGAGEKGIVPCLWFDSEAEEAANFYASIFKDSKIGNITRYGNEGKEIHGRDEGSVMTVDFTLDGNHFMALNGGPLFKFNESVSFQVFCDTQEEIDYFWERLTNGGQESQCGWLKDKYGLSWQIVPTELAGLLFSSDKEKSARVMNELLKMRKLDIAVLKNALAVSS